MFASARCGGASAPTFTSTTTMRGLRRLRWNSLRECGVPRRKRETIRIVDRMVIGVRVDQCVPGKEKAGPCLLRAGLERCAAWVTRLPSSMPLACSLGETALVWGEGVCLAREPSTMNHRCRAGAIHKFNGKGYTAGGTPALRRQRRCRDRGKLGRSKQRPYEGNVKGKGH